MKEKEQHFDNEDFKIQYNELIEAGIIKNQRDFCEAVDWNASSMSEALKNKRGVPKHVKMSVDLMYREYKEGSQKAKGNSQNQISDNLISDEFISIADAVERIILTRSAVNDQFDELLRGIVRSRRIEPKPLPEKHWPKQPPNNNPFAEGNKTNSEK